MPAFQPRYALTTWLYHSPGPRFKAESDAFYHCHHRSRAANAAAVGRVSSNKENVPFRSMVTKLLRSPFRRHLLKSMYEQEWTQSLRDSHVHTEAFGQYMATHEHELQVIEAATIQVLDTFRAKDGGKTSRLPRTKEELMHRLTDKDSQKFLQSLQLHWF
uniref:Uncharacterized protein n=1 Tax=Hyaloperonospora arabidopsidis (strain Emoy2) TaxID=559515 RepID=M4BGE3_HYAAE